MTGNESKMQKGRAWWAVWALLSRSSFYKILAVLCLMALAESLSFYRILGGDGRPGSLEELVNAGLTSMFFMAALGMILLILVRTVRQTEEKGRYTLMRLKISQGRRFFIRTTYCALCLTVLFSVQIMLIFCAAEQYKAAGGTGGVSEQFLFLAFYRNEFLHGILPMAETGKWVRNLLLILAFSMEVAGGRKNGVVTLISLFVLTSVWFVSPVGMGYRDGIVDFVSIVVIAAELLQMLFARKSE